MREPASREEGQAVVETVLLGLLLIVPLMWALGVLADIQRSALALTAAAREAGTDAARASSLADNERAIDAAVRSALVDHGLDPAMADVEWASDARRGGIVEVRIRYPVTVLQAPLIGRVAGPSVVVEARHLARIDRYASRE